LTFSKDFPNTFQTFPKSQEFDARQGARLFVCHDFTGVNEWLQMFLQHSIAQIIGF
jgi:hypothetical protein